ALRNPSAISAVACGSRGAASIFESRSNRSSTNWRSCGVMELLPRLGRAWAQMYARFSSPVVVRKLNLGRGKDPSLAGLKAMQMIDRSRKMRLRATKDSAQGDFVRCQHGGKLLGAEKSVFAFALHCQRIEADQDVIDQARMTHDHAAIGHALKKSLHQRAEIGRSGEIVGAREARIERQPRARCAGAELRAQQVEEQRLGRAEAIEEGLIAPALANPGLRRGLFD